MKAIFLAAGLSALVAAPVHAGSFSDPYDQLAVLGDSLADPGNIFFGLPPFTPATGIPHPPYYKGQFSNGNNFAVLLQREFEKNSKPTRNYAFGGARAKQDMDPSPDLPLQTYFMRIDPLFSPTPGTLTVLNFGGNDMLGAFRDPNLTPLSLAATMTEAVEHIGASVLELATSFGITDFVLPNLGNVGASPRVLYGFDPYYGPLATPELAETATKQFNAALTLVAANLRLLGLNIIEVDVYSRLNEIIADPSIVGLNVPPNTIEGCGIPFFFSPDAPAIYDFSACINDPANAEFLFFDDVHPVRQIHKELAKIVVADVRAANMAPVPLPATAGMLLVALAGLARLRRPKAA